MRENRLSGSEGGVALTAPSLPLSSRRFESEPGKVALRRWHGVAPGLLRDCSGIAPGLLRCCSLGYPMVAT